MPVGAPQNLSHSCAAKLRSGWFLISDRCFRGRHHHWSGTFGGAIITGQVLCDFMRLLFMFPFARSISYILSLGTRPGGGRGSCRGPPADCEEVAADGKQEKDYI